MKTAYPWLMLLIGLVLGAGGVALAAPDCPATEVIDCPVEVVIDMEVLDRYCPECPPCPDDDACIPCPDVECREKVPCPPPTIRHPIEVRPAINLGNPHRFDLTGLVATDGDAASVDLGWNWTLSQRWRPVVGLIWTEGTPGTYYHGRSKGGTDDDWKVAAGFRWSFL